MYNEIVKLISEALTVNTYGDMTAVRTERTVFAELRSIGQSEFYQAEAVGLKPEIKFVLADYLDYQGEKYLKYTPYGDASEKEYRVIRTYRNENELELVCTRGVDV